MKVRLMVCCLGGSLVGACAEAPVQAESPVRAAVPEPAAAKVQVAAREPKVEVEAPIGVEVCDAYVADYRRCVETLPVEERAAHAEVIAGQRVAWARAQGDPSRVGELAEACAAARAAARVALPQCRPW